MRIEIHQTMGPQVVIGNPSPRTVEVLDDAGVPFARIGPDGVTGNFAARAWYLTYGPGVLVPAAAASGAEPRWVRASTETNFGWFESRLDSARVRLPAEVIEAGRSAELGRWTIPLRVDGTPVALSGRFRYEPPPTGAYSARLTSAPEIAPGVHVRLLPGRVPGLLVQSSSPEPVLVFGADGEPFLRIDRDGVEANQRSPMWWASARASGRRADAAIDARTAPEWRRVATAPRFSWVEPRAQGPSAAPVGPSAATPFSWEVPVQIGAERVLVTGQAVWKPVE
jgi:hypothetical protein